MKAEGKTLGRPSRTSEEQLAQIRASIAGVAISELSRRYQVSRLTILSTGRP